MSELVRGDPEQRYSSWTAQFDTLRDQDVAAIEDEQSRFADPPLFSVLVAVEADGEGLPDVVMEAMRAQLYERWEVDAIRGSGADDWNSVLESAVGAFVVILDPTVSLRPHSLFLFARAIERNPNTVLIYGDEDIIHQSGVRSSHYFKPDWNEALFRSQNYLGGVVCFRRSSALAVGGFEDEVDDDYGWGLFLKMTADAPSEAIHHLPFIVSQRRAEVVGAAPDYARRQRVVRGLQRRLARMKEDVQVEAVGTASYRVSYSLPERPPAVSIIVLSTCELQVLGPCIEGLLNRTSYPELEIIVVANQVRDRGCKTRRYLDSVAAHPQARVLFYEDSPFNFSKTNNWAAEQARGDLLCFLNDDTEVIGSEWLSAMVTHALQRRVAVVGAKLLYPNGRIQHAGIVLGAGGVAAHAYRGSRNGIDGYHDRAVVDQDVSSVSGACMLVRRQAFEEVGGFDAAFAVSYNDIDLCLRLRKSGWRIVWTPSAELYHKEAASIGEHYVGATAKQWEFELDLMSRRWGRDLMADPHYSPNLSLDPLELWEPAFPPRTSYSWRRSSATPARSSRATQR